MVLTGTSSNSGQTTINAGTLQLGINNALNVNSNIYVNANATWDLNGHNPTVNTFGCPSNTTILLGSGTLTIATGDFGGSGSSTLIGTTGGITKIGGGTLTYSSHGTYTGGTFINGGVHLLVQRQQPPAHDRRRDPDVLPAPLTWPTTLVPAP